jgi:hypothetical protein
MRVCFHAMHVLREQREYAVLEAAEEEHDAWMELERASRPDRAEEAEVRAYKERWRVASRRLIVALEALKAARR